MRSTAHHYESPDSWGGPPGPRATPWSPHSCRGKLALFLLSAVAAAAADLPRFQWQNFTTADGLPDNRVYSIAVDGDRVWAGTDNGLALYENGRWKCFHEADGLSQRAVLSLALDKRTHDLWIGTMGGLNRYSAGRID